MPELPDAAEEVILKPGMTVDEYLKASGYDMEAAKKANQLPILEWLPPADELTPMWILVNILVPAFALFVVSVITTPLQDKLIFGKDTEVDWSGKSGRLWKLLQAEDPLAVPDAPAELEIGGDLADLKMKRANETGIMGAIAKGGRSLGMAEEVEMGGPAPAALPADAGEPPAAQLPAGPSKTK